MGGLRPPPPTPPLLKHMLLFEFETHHSCEHCVCKWWGLPPPPRKPCCFKPCKLASKYMSFFFLKPIMRAIIVFGTCCRYVRDEPASPNEGGGTPPPPRSSSIWFFWKPIIVFANGGGGCAPPPTPRCFKPCKLASIHAPPTPRCFNPCKLASKYTSFLLETPHAIFVFGTGCRYMMNRNRQMKGCVEDVL